MASIKRKFCLGLALGLALPSCRQDAPVPASIDEPAASPAPMASATANAAASAPQAGGAQAVSEETNDFLFDYSYPAEAGNIPKLAALLNSRMDAARDEVRQQSAEGRNDARGDGFPFNKYSSGTTWLVVTDLDRFLSLSANLSSYSGGAHGNSGHDALIWDKEAGIALRAPRFFTSIEALESVIGKDLCDLLNRERSTRRGMAIEPGSDDIFDRCVPLTDTTMLLGSSTGIAFDRIGILMSPYVAGPYAEGSYEFTLPVNGALLEIVKPEYRGFFSARN